MRLMYKLLLLLNVLWVLWNYKWEADLAEKCGDVVPMTFRRIMQTSPPTFVNASLSLIVPLCYLMHGFRRWKEMRQLQNTNNKVVDNEKGGGRQQILLRYFVPCTTKRERGERERETKRERENQSSFISCVLSEVRRTKRETVFWDEPLLRRGVGHAWR